MNTADLILNLVSSHSWAVLLFMVLSLLNNWLSTNSTFPVTLPNWVRPLATIVAGQALAVAAAAAAHLPILYPAIDAALTSLIAISTSHAIWTNGAPGWMQFIGMIASALEGPPPPAPPGPTPPAPPPAVPPVVGAMLAVVIGCVVLPPAFSAVTDRPAEDFQILTACTPQQANTIINSVLNDAEFICIEAGDFTSAPAAALACGIINGAQKLAPELEAFIDQIIAQAQVMKSAGYHFDKPTAKWVK